MDDFFDFFWLKHYAVNLTVLEVFNHASSRGYYESETEIKQNYKELLTEVKSKRSFYELRSRYI